MGNELSEVETLRKQLANAQAESIRRGKMLLKYRDVMLNVSDELEDEGDRVYLGSTNDKEKFEKIVSDLESFGWDQINGESKERDLFAELRSANLLISKLQGQGEFARLREAQLHRQVLWDPKSELDASFHANEFAGELAELAILCNVVKKLERERMGLAGSRDTIEHLGKEAADVVICVDKICARYGIDLWAFVVSKFNEVSEARGFDCFILGHST